MKKVVHHLTRTTRTLLIVATLFVSLLITATRLLLPLVDDYRHELEAQLSVEVGKPVTVGKLGGYLRGFYPELILKEVVIHSLDKQTAVARLKALHIGLNSLHFIRTGEITPSWVTLVGAELTVVRMDDDSLSIKGLGSGGTDKAFPHWLFADGRFEIIESKLFWQNLKIKGPIIELQDIRASLLNDGIAHQLSVQAKLPKEKGEVVTLKMDYQGDIALADRWEGELYLKGEQVVFDRLLEGEEVGAIMVENGVADFEIWGEWKGAELQSVRGDFSLDKPAVSWSQEAAHERNRLALEQLSGLFQLQRQDKEWQLEVADLVVARLGQKPRQAEQLTIGYKDGRVRLAGSYLNIGELREALLNSGLLTESQLEMLSALKPAGHLANYVAIANFTDWQFQQGWFCSRFNHVKLQAWRNLPGIDNAEGRFCGTESEGFLELGSGAVQINLASLFRTPWQISNSEGKIHWQIDSSGWRLFSESLAIETPDIETISRFDFSVKADSPPFLNLQTSFQEGTIANALFYYPVNIMPLDVVDWLDSALVSGHVISGGALFRGYLNEFPFVNNEGVFEVLFDADKTTINYQEGWPVLTEVGAEVRFYQNDLVINANSAILEGAQVEQAEISILGLNRAKWLNIEGVVSGDVNQSMQFLKHSPLHSRVDALLDVVDMQGANRIELTVDVPLRKGLGDPKVTGSAKVKQAKLLIHGVDLVVRDVNGRLVFDESGIEAKGLQANLLEKPVVVDLVRRKHDTLLKATGRVGIEPLSAQFPMAIWPYLEGEAAYDLSLTIPTASADNLSTELRVKSNTKGMELNVPEPYGKRLSEKRDFSLFMPLIKGQKTKMVLNYGNEVRSELLFSMPGDKAFKLLKGEIRVDGGQPQLPQKGLRIAGNLKAVDIDSWLQLEVKEADGQGQGGDFLQALDLSFSKLVWGAYHFDQLSLKLNRYQGGWEGAVSSQFGEGFIRLPDGLNSVDLKAERLIIPNQASDLSDASGSASAHFKPNELPNLNVMAKRLFWKGENLGAIVLKTERLAEGVKISQFEIKSEIDSLEITGSWSLSEGEYQSVLKGRLKSLNVGGLIERLNIADTLKSEGGEVDFSLQWKGSPWDMQLKTIKGELAVRVGKGQLVTVEPGVGRLLGLLSLQTIQRRLALDFSDLFSEGFSFDVVNAHYKVEAGDAWTDDFLLDGPAARIDMQGRMGLANQDFDQIIVVTPKTTENLPIAGALVGGPAVGAAIFVFQKLVGSRIEKVTLSRYSLTGSWSEPELTLLGQDKPWSKRLLERVWMGLSDQETLPDSALK